MSDLCSKCKTFLVPTRVFVCEACESLIAKEKFYLQWRDWLVTVWETDAQIIETEWQYGLPVEYNFNKCCIMESWWRQ